MPDNTQVRLLTSKDLSLVQRLLNTSEFIYQRFTPEELPMLLKHYPALGIFHADSMNAFLLSQTVNPPSAWIGGFEHRSPTGHPLAGQRGIDLRH